MSKNHYTGRVLLVDDEESLREYFKIVLEKDGHEVDIACDGGAALEIFAPERYDLVVQDYRMPDMTGIELLGRLKALQPNLPIVMITAFSTWNTAVEAMRLGAYDYLRKPIDNDELRALVQRVLGQRQLLEASDRDLTIEDFKVIGSSPAMKEVFDLIKRVASTDSTVVIQGESGSGKEMVARMLHMYSLRAQNPLITVNCGAFSETLLESELFGHVKGAFTGAVADKRGLLEVAEGGTFFLDELGEMSPQTQVRFLRLLETREYLPVGSTVTKKADVRFITATNRKLEEEVAEGRFREDLFYRLNVIPIHLPPLRERRDDIPLLAGFFLARYAQKQGKERSCFSAEALAYMQEQEWPGNVRELENTIQRAVTLSEEEEISLQDIASTRPRLGVQQVPPAAAETAIPILGEHFDLEATIAEVERGYLRQALQESGGNLTRAADLLGISFRQIRYKVKKLGVSVS
ncbi:MAG: sigma-54-dependent transcriptional regulator [Planctomycetota bacterium]|jgi:two-component system response regulator PilR (NtrC family)